MTTRTEFELYIDRLLIKKEEALDEQERALLEHYLEAESGDIYISKPSNKRKQKRIDELYIEIENQRKFLNENTNTFRPDFSFEDELEKLDRLEQEIYKLGVIL